MTQMFRERRNQFESETTMVATAIEELVFHYLDVKWDGWENNEGAFGTVSFGLDTRQIVVDISVRNLRTTTGSIKLMRPYFHAVSSARRHGGVPRISRSAPLVRRIEGAIL